MKIYLFLATELEYVKKSRRMNTSDQKIPIEKLVDMIDKGEIIDSKTIISIYLHEVFRLNR